MNNVSLIGRLVFDPELKYVNDDRAVCTFCLAVSRNYRNKDGVIPTDFINIDIWGRRAETLCLKRFSNRRRRFFKNRQICE